VSSRVGTGSLRPRRRADCRRGLEGPSTYEIYLFLLFFYSSDLLKVVEKNRRGYKKRVKRKRFLAWNGILEGHTGGVSDCPFSLSMKRQEPPLRAAPQFKVSAVL
jgi:hypothetical protein